MSSIDRAIGRDFPEQQAKIRECLKNGIKIGSAGRFYVAVCEEILKRAEEAAISGDITLILRSYNEMKEFQE